MKKYEKLGEFKEDVEGGKGKRKKVREGKQGEKMVE